MRSTKWLIFLIIAVAGAIVASAQAPKPVTYVITISADVDTRLIEAFVGEVRTKPGGTPLTAQERQDLVFNRTVEFYKETIVAYESQLAGTVASAAAAAKARKEVQIVVTKPDADVAEPVP